MLRRTRSSHPWALPTRHPWRVTVRCNTPPPPPDVAYPPCIETRCLTPLVRCASLRSARCARTDALRVVTWIGCPSAAHSVSTSIPERSGTVEFIRVAEVRCAGPSRAMDGAWGAPMDGSSVSGAPNLRHPCTIRSRRTEPPSPVNHPKSAREVPRRRATPRRAQTLSIHRLRATRRRVSARETSASVSPQTPAALPCNLRC